MPTLEQSIVNLTQRVELLERLVATLRLSYQDLRHAANAVERVADPLLIQFDQVDVMHNMNIPPKK